MTKEKLLKFRGLKRELATLEERAKETESLLNTAIKYSKESGYNSSPKLDSWETKVIDLIAAKDAVKKKMEEILELRKEVEEYIEGLPDSEYKQILFLYILCGMSFREVGETLNYNHSALYKKYIRFMNNMD